MTLPKLKLIPEKNLFAYIEAILRNNSDLQGENKCIKLTEYCLAISDAIIHCEDSSY